MSVSEPKRTLPFTNKLTGKLSNEGWDYLNKMATSINNLIATGEDTPIDLANGYIMVQDGELVSTEREKITTEDMDVLIPGGASIGSELMVPYLEIDPSGRIEYADQRVIQFKNLSETVFLKQESDQYLGAFIGTQVSKDAYETGGVYSSVPLIALWENYQGLFGSTGQIHFVQGTTDVWVNDSGNPGVGISVLGDAIWSRFGNGASYIWFSSQGVNDVGTDYAVFLGASEYSTEDMHFKLPPNYPAAGNYAISCDINGYMDYIEVPAAYTDEEAQDAVGTILVDSSEINFTYNDGTPSITASLINGSVAYARFVDGTGLSIIGRSANSAGANADIVASSDYQVLRRSGTSIGFGAIALNQSNAVTGTLPVGNGGTGVDAILSASASSSSSTTLATLSFTKLIYNSETFDIGSCYDPTTNYRYTPNKAGIYLVTGLCYVSPAIASTIYILSVYKNGSRYADIDSVYSGTTQFRMCGSTLISMNGSTDYLELYAYNNASSGTSSTNVSLSAYNNFSIVWVGPN